MLDLNLTMKQCYFHFVEETSAQLVKHLLKTVCSDITNIVVSAVATEHMMSVQEDTQLTPEVSFVIFKYNQTL